MVPEPNKRPAPHARLFKGSKAPNSLFSRHYCERPSFHGKPNRGSICCHRFGDPARKAPRGPRAQRSLPPGPGGGVAAPPPAPRARLRPTIRRPGDGVGKVGSGVGERRGAEGMETGPQPQTRPTAWLAAAATNRAKARGAENGMWSETGKSVTYSLGAG